MLFLLNAETSSLTDLWKWIDFYDKWLFKQINNNWSNTLFDAVFPVYRESITWVPLYLFLFVFVLINFRWKAWPWILFLIVTVTLTDQISSSLVKDFFMRTRPCSDDLVSEFVRLRMNRCPSSGSFTSSHATNHFGAAVFIAMTMKDYFKKGNLMLFFWATTICYGQVYVGVHYPLDVIGGGLLGSLIGYATATFYKSKVGIPELKPY